MKRQIIPIMLLLGALCVFFVIVYKWKQNNIEEQQTAIGPEEEQQETIVVNDNYIPPNKPEVVEVGLLQQKEKLEKIQQQQQQTEQQQDKQTHSSYLYDWVKNYTGFLMQKFQIDHAHREIFKAVYDFINTTPTEKAEECDFMFEVFSKCPTLSVSKKMDIAVYIVWKSRKQEQIDHVYDTIMSIASDNQENPKVRANALEILMRSNNRIYMDRSRKIMANLQEHEKVQEMAAILQRMEKIQTAMRERAEQQQQLPPQRPGGIPLTPYQQANQHLNGPPPITPEEAQVQQALLDQYRRLERRAFNAMNKAASVYDDSQNVHNHKINESVVESAQNIMANTGGLASPMVSIEKELEKYYPGYATHKTKIHSSLNRIRSDPSKFKGNTTIAQVFDRVVGIISNSRYKEEMWRRLGEELVDMNQLCATGHLSRIINVIQGFQDVPLEFQIKMDPKDEIYANISNYITKQVQESGEADKLLESMIDPENRSLFVGFVCIILKPKVEELYKEYQGLVEPERLKECIHTSIHNYVKNDAETKTILDSLSS